MREIKFRAWDRDRKKMFIPSSFGLPWITDLREKRSNCVLMQFTGLMDRADQDIYEGDIVRIPKFGAGHNDASQNTVVEYNDRWARFRFRLPTGGYYDPVPHWEIEVVGNLYENPELLE